MEIDLNKQTLTINKLVGTKTKTIKLEGDIIVPDVKPDIINTMDSVGNICLYKKEVLDGRIKIDGGINLYLIYLADTQEDSIRGLNTTLDFTEIIDMEGCHPDMDLISTMEIRNIECKILNGRKIKVSVEVEIQLQIYSNENVEVVTGVNNLPNVQTLQKTMNINTLVGTGSTKISAKDVITYEETDDLAEILKVDISIGNQETKTSYQKVLLKADAKTKIMYLTEEGTIKVISSNIPIMGFVDIANVSEENIIHTNYDIKNILIKPNGNEEHSILVEVEVEATCRVYGNITTEVIQDIYSTHENLGFTTKAIETENHHQQQIKTCHLNEKISIPEIANHKICDVEIKPTIQNAKVLNQKMIYEGEVVFNFISSSNMEVMAIHQYQIPFNFEIEGEEIHPDQKVVTQIECVGDDFVILSDGEIECKVDLMFCLEVSDAIKLDLIDEISVEEDRNLPDYSMIIYIVKQEDNLWEIAKKYKTTMQSIMEINGLENEKINIGDKLYIPRCKNNTIKTIA